MSEPISETTELFLILLIMTIGGIGFTLPAWREPGTRKKFREKFNLDEFEKELIEKGY